VVIEATERAGNVPLLVRANDQTLGRIAGRRSVIR